MGAAGSGRRAAFEEAISLLAARPQIMHLTGSKYAASMQYGVLSFMLAQLDDGQASTRHELVHGLADLLCRDGQRTIVTLGAPDLVDADSAAILGQLAAMEKIFLVAVCEKLADLPTDLLALYRAGRLTSIAVHRMAFSETRAYLETELGGPISTFAAAGLWHLTRSNRDLLHQLVRDLVASGKLALKDECWVFVPGGLRVGPATRAHVTRTIAALDTSELELIELLASGGPIETARLRGSEWEPPVSGLRSRGLVDVGEMPRGTVRLRVPLLGHLLRDRMELQQDPKMDRLLSKVYADPRAARVLAEVNSMLELGNLEALVAVVEEYALNGGYAPEVWNSSPKWQMTILQAEIDALMTLGRHGRASASISRAAETLSVSLEQNPEDVSLYEMFQSLQVIKARMSIADGSPAAVERILQVAVTGGEKAELNAKKNSALDDSAVLEAVESSVWASEEVHFRAMAVQAEAWALSDRPQEALTLVARIDGDLDGLRMTGVLDQVMSDQQCADIECAMLRVQLVTGAWREAGNRARSLASGLYSDPRSINFGATMVGILGALSGTADAALGTLLPALAQLNVTSGPAQRNLVEAAVAYCFSDQERNSEAAELLLGNRPVLEREFPLGFSNWAAEVLSSLSIANLNGSATAMNRLNVLAGQARSANCVMLELGTLATALRLGQKEAARRILEVVDAKFGTVAQGYLDMAQSVLTDDGPALGSAIEHLAEMGHSLYAVESGNEMWSILGNKERRRVVAAGNRSRQIDEAGVPNQPDENGIERENPAWIRELTKREAQIALRVIEGMSNAAIARLSGVSVRTVEGHLYQVYSKLQVRNRQELADLDQANHQTVLAP